MAEQISNKPSLDINTMLEKALRALEQSRLNEKMYKEQTRKAKQVIHVLQGQLITKQKVINKLKECLREVALRVLNVKKMSQEMQSKYVKSIEKIMRERQDEKNNESNVFWEDHQLNCQYKTQINCLLKQNQKLKGIISELQNQQKIKESRMEQTYASLSRFTSVQSRLKQLEDSRKQYQKTVELNIQNSNKISDLIAANEQSSKIIETLKNQKLLVEEELQQTNLQFTSLKINFENAKANQLKLEQKLNQINQKLNAKEEENITNQEQSRKMMDMQLVLKNKRIQQLQQVITEYNNANSCKQIEKEALITQLEHLKYNFQILLTQYQQYRKQNQHNVTNHSNEQMLFKQLKQDYNDCLIQLKRQKQANFELNSKLSEFNRVIHELKKERQMIRKQLENQYLVTLQSQQKIKEYEQEIQSLTKKLKQKINQSRKVQEMLVSRVKQQEQCVRYERRRSEQLQQLYQKSQQRTVGSNNVPKHK